jgi:hypothetical protein
MKNVYESVHGHSKSDVIRALHRTRKRVGRGDECEAPQPKVPRIIGVYGVHAAKN